MAESRCGASIVRRARFADGLCPEKVSQQGDQWSWVKSATVRISTGVNLPLCGSYRVSQNISDIMGLEQRFSTLDDAEIAGALKDLQRAMHRFGLTLENVKTAFAIIRELANRILGMKPFKTQLMGGFILVCGGLAEMETGEGKTLAASLAAGTLAMAGIPVHVVTVNDYLAKRDAEFLQPLYEALGLTVGISNSSVKSAERRLAYSCSITYCTNKQLVFDYLRDRILMGGDPGSRVLEREQLKGSSHRFKSLYLRGLHFAIIDEADSVLIDEASTPLIISRSKSGGEEIEMYQQALVVAEELEQGVDFEVENSKLLVTLTNSGKERLQHITKPLGGVWSGLRRSEELVVKALAALHVYDRDTHYLVKQDKVVIVDKNTGRIMADRSWGQGLHQMIEVKEGCTVTGRKDHLGRMTHQRFFSRYLNLAGMTGTASEVRKEMHSVYNLNVMKVPVCKHSRRRFLGRQVYVDKEAKMSAIIDRIEEFRTRGRPVLVGTNTVGDSEALGAILLSRGVDHSILNARQDKYEAEVIAGAGASGAITVATNMAGRGTDIGLGVGVPELGGLHVILSDCNDSKRLDRQLIGRCARQGDPGSYDMIFSLEDQLITIETKERWQKILHWLVKNKLPFSQLFAFRAIWKAQRLQEKRSYNVRKDLQQLDEQLDTILAFSGRRE